MNPHLRTVSQLVGCTLIAATALLGAGAMALAQDKPAVAAAAAPAKDFKDERALKLLKGMSDKLAGAKSLSFQFRGLVPPVRPPGSTST